ncbi:MAG: NAD-dependent epimerase/dehydratase family protein [Acidobacteriaceae bacterium]|nr:NAD-dependent epimerase/dehydratase family protein [Acidobacteriaceae bacterium]MBV9780087.1 NAD-dependent epimerase/dehydratase family protein [Acidobacteriaceae bacterium]
MNRPFLARRVFITGGTGYIGTRVIPLLRKHGHSVIALSRESSPRKLPPDCSLVIGDALNGESYKDHLSECDTFIHLVGVSHPGPAKARQFVEIDLKSAREAIRVAHNAGIQHFIYMSVAHPAPVMKAYIDVRSSCEDALRETGMNATILRPWYVLGPGHRWPVVLKPFYRLAESFPAMRDGARRLGLVTLDEMVNTVVSVTEDPASGVWIVEVPEIRSRGHAL